MTASPEPEQPSRRPSNRLIHETSPYLLQHAHNPVDWYPWGDEAFDTARKEDKPVFLSVGYSACHWCHVMEHESFENDAIAAVMNERYVNIKVDREERPDVDQIYMAAVQLMTQRGGWPMSVFLTPDGRPFYGGTYWPPTARMGMPGFRDLLLKLHEYWVNRRDEVLSSAASLVDAVGRIAAPVFETSPLHAAMLQNAMEELLESADRRDGGFGSAPKFPHPMDLRVLLRASRRFGNDDALAVARLTLDKMAQGGIYDHLGGGFHRYATDAHWLVPHFEKMLYDNALLTPVYLEAWQITRAPLYETVVRETLDYVLREMTQPQGGFYSTQDADSEGVEGKFFVWTEDEVIEALGPDSARVFCYAYDVTPRGNWEGHNILNRPKSTAQAARVLGLDEADLHSQLAEGRKTLFALRETRVHPGRDDKMLVAWNGMMISAMAQAAQILDEPAYADAASRAADFILTQMRTATGGLLHSYKDGRARFAAYLDDYACLIDGLVDLYQSTFAPRWLEGAVELADRMIADFADESAGGFFYTAHDHEKLIARSKDAQDNATPSGNGVAATALLRLGRLCGRQDFEDRGVRTLESLSGLIGDHPRSAGQALLALDFLLGPTREIVVVDGADPAEGEELLRVVHGMFLPNKVIARRPTSVTESTIPEMLRPLLEGRANVAGRAAVHVCDRGRCGLPVSTADDLRRILDDEQDSVART